MARRRSRRRVNLPRNLPRVCRQQTARHIAPNAGVAGSAGNIADKIRNARLARAFFLSAALWRRLGGLATRFGGSNDFDFPS
jgi:hypothetical protein